MKNTGLGRATRLAAAWRSAVLPLAGAVALGGATAPAHADPADVVNAFRTNGCGREPAPGAQVRRDRELDRIAEALARDTELEAAVRASDYPASSSTSFHVRGSRADAEIARILERRSCAAISDSRYEDIGVFQRGDETWIVLAQRQPETPPLDPAATARRVLELVNAARAEARRCGRERFEPTHPLTTSPALMAAAQAHARDMAARRTLTHEGSDGSASGERIARAGYEWRAAGENVAAGQKDADAVVAAWLQSPGHCATLMGPHFTQTGIAFALAPEQNPGIYWAQAFAAPRAVQ